jgi:hypothetical protein
MKSSLAKIYPKELPIIEYTIIRVLVLTFFFFSTPGTRNYELMIITGPRQFSSGASIGAATSLTLGINRVKNRKARISGYSHASRMSGTRHQWRFAYGVKLHAAVKHSIRCHSPISARTHPLRSTGRAHSACHDSGGGNGR